MTKADFITRVRENSELSKAQIDEVLATILDTIVECVAEGEKVNFVGFGSFERHERKAKDGVNPKTKEKITIPAKVVPKFKVGKLFKDTVTKSK